jgi:hypothetical protein
MKTRRTLFVLSFTAALVLSCATAGPPPEWAASPNGLSLAFPEAEYLAQLGRGPTRQAAEADGAAAIARFLNSEIRSSISVREQLAETGGNVSSGTEALAETFVQSQVELFGVRYAADAWYDRERREWLTAAFISRAEAWDVYGPRFKQQADAFLALFRAGQSEADPFRRALSLSAARAYAQSPEFSSADDLGRLLFPSRMNAEFEEVRAALGELPQLIQSAKGKAPVYIDCPADFESRLSGAFAEVFAAQGFPVTGSRGTAAAVCTVSVDEGVQVRDMGIFYYPSLRAVIRGVSGEILSFTAQAEQAGAVTPDVAKRRAYTALADRVRAGFPGVF